MSERKPCPKCNVGLHSYEVMDKCDYCGRTGWVTYGTPSAFPLPVHKGAIVEAQEAAIRDLSNDDNPHPYYAKGDPRRDIPAKYRRPALYCISPIRAPWNGPLLVQVWHRGEVIYACDFKKIGEAMDYIKSHAKRKAQAH